jgi:hypothetical protein
MPHVLYYFIPIFLDPYAWFPLILSMYGINFESKMLGKTLYVVYSDIP